MSVPALYGKHRAWALAVAGDDATDEDRLTALVVLWSTAREWTGGGGFKAHARTRIEEALARERAGRD